MSEQDRAAYRDTALKVLVLGVSGVTAYLASTAQAGPRVDYMVVTWLAIIALADLGGTVSDNASGTADLMEAVAELGVQVAALMGAKD